MLTDAMRFITTLVVFVLPFAAHAAAIGYDGARHLLNRVGHGPGRFVGPLVGQGIKDIRDSDDASC